MSGELLLGLGLNSEKFKEGIHEASHMTDELGEKLKMLGEAIGIAFAFTETIEFMKDAYKEVVELHKEMIGINLLLQQNGKYNDENLSKLKEQREEYEKIGISAAETAKIQEAVLTKFPKGEIGGITNVTERIMDYAALTNKAPEEAANSLIKAMSRYATTGTIRELQGISQPDIAKLTDYGAGEHTAEQRDQYLLEILDKYKEFAQKLRESDPLYEYNSAILKLKETTGDLVIDLVKEFIPEIKAATLYLNDIIKNHLPEIKEYIIKTAYALKDIAEILIAYKIGSMLINFSQGLIAATKTITELLTLSEVAEGSVMAQGIGAAVATAIAANPIGVALLTIGGLIGGIAIGVDYIAYKNKQTEAYNAGVDLNNEAARRLNPAISEVSAGKANSGSTNPNRTLAAFQEGMLGTEFGDILQQRIENKDINSKFLKEHISQFVTDLRDDKIWETLFTKSGAEGEGLNKVIALFNDEFTKLYKQFGKNEKGLKAGNTLGVEGSKVSESKVTSQSKQIIINIKELVHDFKIINESGNLKESAAEIERIVTEAILNGLQAGQQLSH